jgi:hypothetical protein
MKVEFFKQFFSIFGYKFLENMCTNLANFFKTLNSGYLKSEKALDFSTFKFFETFFLVTYMKKCIEIWRFFKILKTSGYLKSQKAPDFSTFIF